MKSMNYNDYMRNVLGCSHNNPTPYQSYNDLESMYPDTYRVIYPMVVSACNGVAMPISEEMLDRMTDDIYDRAELDSRININMNMTGSPVRSNNSRQFSGTGRRPRPRPRNRFLRDLIRILLLRQLLGRRR